MVTTPQEIALIDVVKAVSMFKKVEIPILGVVENMSYYKCPACGHHDEIFARGGGKRLAQELGTRLPRRDADRRQGPVRRRLGAAGRRRRARSRSTPRSS